MADVIIHNFLKSVDYLLITCIKSTIVKLNQYRIFHKVNSIYKRIKKKNVFRAGARQ